MGTEMGWLAPVEQLTYLIAASLFIVGLKFLGSPATARKGNVLASVGMLLAIVVTLLDQEIVDYTTIFVGILIGSAAGAIAAQKVEMTSMPQMVGLLNGFGGAASALVAIGEYWRLSHAGLEVPMNVLVTAVLGVLIGGVTLTGSIMAFGKLQGLISGSPVTYPLQQPVNLSLLIGFIVGGVYLIVHPNDLNVFFEISAVSLVLGILFVLPIGGADTPVVISLLNSFSGLAASAAGFVLGNDMLIIAGALVGASGLILTQIMCKAMNRSLVNVLFGAFGGGATATAGTAGSGSGVQKSHRSVDAEEGGDDVGLCSLRCGRSWVRNGSGSGSTCCTGIGGSTREKWG